MLLLLSGSALAGPAAPPDGQAATVQEHEPVAGPASALPATVSDWRALYVALRHLHETHGRAVALGAVGPEARRVARKAVALFTGGEVVLRPVPTQGDPDAELDLVHSVTGASCVVWMTAAPAGWSLSARGDCGPTTPPPGDAPPALPPLLQIQPRRGTPSWRVYDDAGHWIDTWRYASLTRDAALRDRLVVERRRRRLGASLLEAGGVVLACAAVVPLVQSFSLPPEQAEDRRMTAVFLVTSGGSLHLGGRLDRRGLDARQAEVGHYVHRSDAEAAIDDWNQQALRRRARIQSAAVQAVDRPAEDGRDGDAPAEDGRDGDAPAKDGPGGSDSPGPDAAPPGEEARP